MGIPGGVTYYLPITGWRPRQNSSFKGVADALYEHLRANPTVLARLGWPLDKTYIADQVDAYNTKICEANGWSQYITDEAAGGRPAPPFRAIDPAAAAPALAPATACCGRGVPR
jgi:hypothetical protein